MSNTDKANKPLNRALNRADLINTIVIGENTKGDPELFLEVNDAPAMLILMERAKQALIEQMARKR